MWVYEKKLQYPIKIKNPNPAMAKIIISQYGGTYFKKIYIISANKNNRLPQNFLSVAGGYIYCIII